MTTDPLVRVVADHARDGRDAALSAVASFIETELFEEPLYVAGKRKIWRGLVRQGSAVEGIG